MMSNDALSCVILSNGDEVRKPPLLDNGHGTHGSNPVCLKRMGRVTYEMVVWCDM